MDSKLNHSVKLITESSLKVDLGELAHSFAREFSMAAKKVAIYGSSHPMAEKAVERPFLILDRICRYKRYVGFNLQRDYLYLLGIRLKESVFSAEIIQVMQLRDVNAMLFMRGLSQPEFSLFIEKLVNRTVSATGDNSLVLFVKEQKIPTIEINSEKAYALFESGRQYRGDVDGDFSIKCMALDQIGDKLERIAKLNGADEKLLESYGIDYEPNLVSYLLPERIASFSVERIRRELEALANRIKNDQNSEDRSQATDTYMSIFQLLDFHPEREAIIENLEVLSVAPSDDEDKNNSSGQVEIIKTESREKIDNIIAQTFSSENDNDLGDEFTDSFVRLLRTSQKGKAIEIVTELLERLESNDLKTRKNALNLLICTIENCDLLSDSYLIHDTVKRIIGRIDQQLETFEYSEFIWSLIKKFLEHKCYSPLSDLIVGIAIRRKIDKGVTIYESMVVKTVFANFDRAEIIRSLIDDLVKGSPEEAAHIRNVLIAAGSETVALELSNIISHPVRQVRQHALKILAELGKASMIVFSRILSNDAMFEREAGRHELSDSKWYVIRNSIFVLGSLGDTEGLNPLRLRLSDPDVRVRREIIATLEKIGGEDACDLAVVMASDSVREIAEAATITVGLIGSPDMVPMLINTMYHNPMITLKAIGAMGKIGGESASDFLSSIIDNEEVFSKVQAGQISKDSLWLAVVKALGQIGDLKSINKIKQFRDNQPAALKLFFKNTVIDKEISSILARVK